MSLLGVIKKGAKIVDGLLDETAEVAAKEWDEAAWLAENPRPHPDVKKRDMTTDQLKQYNSWTTRRYRAKNAEAVRESNRVRAREKYQNDSEHAERVKDRTRKRYREDEAYRESRKASQAARRSEPGFNEKKAARERERYATDEEYRKRVDQKNADARRRRMATDPEYRARNAANASATRQVRNLRGAPWADKEKINEIYKSAAHVTEITGVPHEVDHVIPVQGRNVSGLHHQDNLLIVPRNENRAKYNSFEPGDLPPRAGVRKARALLKKIKEEYGITE